MAVMKVLEYPNPILHQKSEKVSEVTAETRCLLDDMLETMYDDDGVGLAAPQVGVLQRMLVIDYERDENTKGNPMYFINPEILWVSEEKVCGKEGCLSVPGQSAEVERFAQIRVRYLDYHGKEQEILADGFLAIVLQHEMDHLDGILYIDRLSRLKRNMVVKKLEKDRREKSV